MTMLSPANPEPLTCDIFVGGAGWSIPREHASQFAATVEDGDTAGTHLTRYARRLPAVEINSSFYRSHRPATYARWAASVPAHFRFSVKMPRQITHIQRLRETEEMLTGFVGEAEALGEKLGSILVQLPPSLVFAEAAASGFFAAVRERFGGFIVCEPRHASWFHPDAEAVMQHYHVARVAADPVMPVPEAAEPGGWRGILYYRLHGSPQIYYSAYSEEYLAVMVQTLKQGLAGVATEAVWCIFDNTAAGAATANALRVFAEVKS